MATADELISQAKMAKTTAELDTITAQAEGRVTVTEAVDARRAELAGNNQPPTAQQSTVADQARAYFTLTPEAQAQLRQQEIAAIQTQRETKHLDEVDPIAGAPRDKGFGRYLLSDGETLVDAHGDPVKGG